MSLVFIILDMNIKKFTESNEINSVNPLYLRIKDMKGQFKKRKSDNVWYLIILQIFVKVLELKLKKIQVVLYSMIKIT